jgi:hypothetical protein
MMTKLKFFTIIKHFTTKEFDSKVMKDLLKKYEKVEYKGINNVNEEIYYCYSLKHKEKSPNLHN